MCGIVGYVGTQKATSILVEGLRKLEYRGYDSAGVAVLSPKDDLQVARCQGKLANLEKKLESAPTPGTTGIGHTRWATHGRPSDENAHPHQSGPIALVHNGIIENHVALRIRLQAAGRTFTSETDTEIIAHLIDEALEKLPENQRATSAGFAEAVRKAIRQLEGAFALGVVSAEHPGELIVAKNASPLVMGIGSGEMFIASDAPALLQHTREVVFLEDGDMAIVRADGPELSDLEGNPIQRPSRTLNWSAAQAEKDGYEHFMLKEIHEQPTAVINTLRERLLPDVQDAQLEGFEFDPATTKRLVLLACGTSYHACMLGKYLIESLARVPVEVDLASEFRYRDPIIQSTDLVIGVSQSGETADTLAALREAKDRGGRHPRRV